MTPTSNTEATPELQIAPPHTLLGQLQRGTGAGYLHALRTPTAELWPLLEHCLLNDPRWDAQWERRAAYYADLMRATGMPPDVLCHRILALDGEEREEEDDAYWLPLGTLHACALQQEPQALQFLQDYSRSGRAWMKAMDCLLDMEEPIAWAGLDEVLLARLTDEELREEAWRFDLELPAWQEWRKRHPRIAAVMAAEEARIAELRKGRRDTETFAGHPLEPLLEATYGQNTVFHSRVVRALVQPSDFALLQRNLLPEEPDRCAAAIAGLAALGTPEAFQAIARLIGTQLAETDTDLEKDHRMWRALRRACLKSPAEWVLPLARQWTGSPHPHLSHLGETVVAEFAEAQDLPLLLAGVDPAFAEDAQYRLCNLAEGLGRTGCPQALPALQRIYRDATYAWTRRYAAESLRKLAPERYRQHQAMEELWDCDECIRLHAVRHVDLNLAHHRLTELAEDPLEDQDVREAAAERLAAASLTLSRSFLSELDPTQAGKRGEG